VKAVNVFDFRALTDHKNKLTFVTLRNSIKALMSQASNIDSSPFLLEENTATLHYAFVLVPLNPLNKVITTKVNQLINSGLVEKMEKAQFYDHKTSKNDEQKALILTMDHLGVCFLIIMICLVLCCAVFTAECLIKRYGNA
jgi:hypothetical protein